MMITQAEKDKKGALVAKEADKKITEAEKLDPKDFTDPKDWTNKKVEINPLLNPGSDRKAVLEAKLANKTITETEKSELHLLSYK